jgi:RNA polymerase sigma factor (sigma-70 family)
MSLPATLRTPIEGPPPTAAGGTSWGRIGVSLGGGSEVALWGEWRAGTGTYARLRPPARETPIRGTVGVGEDSRRAAVSGRRGSEVALWGEWRAGTGTYARLRPPARETPIRGTVGVGEDSRRAAVSGRRGSEVALWGEWRAETGTCARLCPPARETPIRGTIGVGEASRRAATLGGRLSKSDILETAISSRLYGFPRSSAILVARPAMDLELLSDEELIERARGAGGDADALLAALYERYYPKVAGWCLRLSGDRQAAADLAQEVFLRVHERLGGFRGESRFSTWLYTVTRSVVINRGTAARRRETRPLDDEGLPEPVEPAPGAEETAARGEIARALREAMARDLEPLEARALYLHFVDGLSLPAVTDLLRLTNKSGAKALIVSGGRKLKRRFGRWLGRQSAAGGLP